MDVGTPLRRSTVPGDTAGRQTAGVRRTTILVGLAVTAGGVLLDRTGLAGPAPEATTGTWPVLGLLCLAAGALGALAVRTLAGRATALLGTAAGGAGVAVAVVSAVATGEPGPSTGLLAVGGLAVVAGAALLAVAPAREARGRARDLLRSAGMLLLVIAMAAGGALVADRVPVRSQTAAAAEPVDPEPVLRPGALRWRWTAPGRVDDVVPTAFGVTVRSGDPVSGVDGTTGATWWTYRRAGAALDALTVSPDGRTVVAASALGEPSRSRTQRITVLDAGTGALRWDAVLDAWPDVGPFQVSDRVLTVLEEVPASSDNNDDSEYRVVARSLTDGATVWHRIPPEGCALTGGGLVERAVRYPEPLRSHDVLVAWQDCGRHRVGLGLDDRDGTVRWELPPVEVVDETGYVGPEYFPVSTPDARTAVFAHGGGASVLVEAENGRVVARLPEICDTTLFRSRPGATAVLLRLPGSAAVDGPGAVLDPLTGTISPLGPGCDGDDVLVAVTAQATLRLCGAGPEFGLSSDGGPVVPVDPGPPVLDPPGGDEVDAWRGPGSYPIVPAPGALVVGVTSTNPGVLTGFAPAPGTAR